MLPLRILIGSALLTVISSAAGQEKSLCNPCVDPPTYDTQRPPTEASFGNRNFSNDPPILSVEDIFGQLPDEAAPKPDEDVTPQEDESPPAENTDDTAAPEETPEHDQQ